MIEQIISDIETTENVDVDANKDVAATPLAAFWAEHRLLHKQDALRKFLGTETMQDLDDVHPGDLRTVCAVQWAQATLSVAEANRLARAVQDYHAARQPSPEYGPQWFPAHGRLPNGLPPVTAFMREDHV
jgi:hypothetical protein